MHELSILSHIYVVGSIQNCAQKGDGNDGEPDACRKLELKKKGQKLFGIKQAYMAYKLRLNIIAEVY